MDEIAAFAFPMQTITGRKWGTIGKHLLCCASAGTGIRQHRYNATQELASRTGHTSGPNRSSSWQRNRKLQHTTSIINQERAHIPQDHTFTSCKNTCHQTVKSCYGVALFHCEMLLIGTRLLVKQEQGHYGDKLTTLSVSVAATLNALGSKVLHPK